MTPLRKTGETTLSTILPKDQPRALGCSELISILIAYLPDIVPIA